MIVRKAVIPAAGLGTRFLPATKAQPKAMIPIVDVPAIQLVVEEAARVGLHDVLVVAGRGQVAIEDHFDRSPELEGFLEAKGKTEQLEAIRAISRLAQVHVVRQQEPLGLGHAVSLARAHVGDEPFAVLLADDLIHPSAPLLAEMLRVHGKYGRSVIAGMEVPKPDIASYGCIEPERVEDHLDRVVSVIEKPDPERAPSNVAVIGRYVFTPEIFDVLDRITPGSGGELQLTDAINLLAQEQAVYAYRFDEGRFDVGNPLDYLKATVELAVEREDVGPAFRDWLWDFAQRRKLV
ncbi:MAG: UTP--glucose-1-phosphate uridylyltransferase [Actinomycetota bacterium]|nr:MAG: UTP--glucose-1-phosphate uridylyltransferase [Actinomycetota bacterium]